MIEAWKPDDLEKRAKEVAEWSHMVARGLVIAHDLGAPLKIDGNDFAVPDAISEKLRAELPEPSTQDAPELPIMEAARRAIFVMAGAAHEIEKILTPEQPQPTEIKKLSLEGVRAAEAQGQAAAPSKREPEPLVTRIDDCAVLVANPGGSGGIILETVDHKSWRLVSNDNKSWLLAWHPDYQSAEFEAIERVRQGRWMPDTTLNDGSERPRVDRSRPAVFWGRNHRQRFDS